MNVSIPTEYKQYGKVELCSNILENVKYFFGINDIPPLIIGRRDNKPICWIFIQSNGIWQEIISANKSNYLPLQVFAHETKLLIQLGDKIILDSYEKEDNTLVIQKLDLKPLGFNIDGDLKGLNIGGNLMSGNKITGAKYFVGLG